MDEAELIRGCVCLQYINRCVCVCVCVCVLQTVIKAINTNAQRWHLGLIWPFRQQQLQNGCKHDWNQVIRWMLLQKNVAQVLLLLINYIFLFLNVSCRISKAKNLHSKSMTFLENTAAWVSKIDFTSTYNFGLLTILAIDSIGNNLVLCTPRGSLSLISLMG